MKAIVVHSVSGRAARMIARHRQEKPVFALTNRATTKQQLALSWGVQTILVPTCRTLDQLIQTTSRIMLKAKLIKRGEYIVLVTGQPVGKSGGSNLVKLHQV